MVKLFFIQCSDTVGWVTGRAACEKTCCWIVVGDDLTGALHILIAPVSPPSPSSLAPIKSRMEKFWYHLTLVHLEK